MKRIALIIALAVVISVGGVYATWVYSTATVSPINEDISAKLSITTVDSTDSTKGVLSMPNSLSMTIDDDNGDHMPDWDADIASTAGELTIKFTPNTGASPTTFTYYITVASYTYTCPSHGSVSIFNPTDANNEVAGMQIISGQLVYNGGSTPVSETFTADEVQTALNLNTALQLDTLDEYNAYSTAVGNVVLTLHVIENTTP